MSALKLHAAIFSGAYPHAAVRRRRLEQLAKAVTRAATARKPKAKDAAREELIHRLSAALARASNAVDRGELIRDLDLLRHSRSRAVEGRIRRFWGDSQRDVRAVAKAYAPGRPWRYRFPRPGVIEGVPPWVP
jgi:hypothetical protein